MDRRKIIDALNRLLVLMHRSLARYVVDAAPWVPPNMPQASQAQLLLANLVADQKMYAGKLADMVISDGGTLDFGEFPMQFTDINDLSLDFMLGEILNCQRQDVAAIEACARDLAADNSAKALADEILGNARGHLQSLKDLAGAKKPVAS